ncbi:MAG: hypothetical protein Q9227_008461 [Pyrenula ochraceoflavens]
MAPSYYTVVPKDKKQAKLAKGAKGYWERKKGDTSSTRAVIVSGSSTSSKHSLQCSHCHHSGRDEKAVSSLPPAAPLQPFKKEPIVTVRSVSAPAEQATPDWTAEQDATLRDLKGRGKTWADIATQLGKTKGDVTGRWKVLNGKGAARAPPTEPNAAKSTLGAALNGVASANEAPAAPARTSKDAHGCGNCQSCKNFHERQHQSFSAQAGNVGKVAEGGQTNPFYQPSSLDDMFFPNQQYSMPVELNNTPFPAPQRDVTPAGLNSTLFPAPQRNVTPAVHHNAFTGQQHMGSGGLNNTAHTGQQPASRGSINNAAVTGQRNARDSNLNNVSLTDLHHIQQGSLNNARTTGQQNTQPRSGIHTAFTGRQEKKSEAPLVTDKDQQLLLKLMLDWDGKGDKWTNLISRYYDETGKHLLPYQAQRVVRGFAG